MENIEIIFLGTNGWYDTNTGNTICTLIRANNTNIVLDAGIGLYKLDQYIDKNNPTYIFLSHLHLDHIFGLHILNKFKFKRVVNIIIPKGMSKYLKRIIQPPYTVSFSKLSYKVVIKEINSRFISPFFYAQSTPLRHSGESYGYKFIFNKKEIVYCPDTAYCRNAIRIAENADLLIAECSLLARKNNSKWGHLNPEKAAIIAKKAKVKRLVLTHFSANAYHALKDRDEAKKRATRIFNDTTIAKDGMRMLI